MRIFLLALVFLTIVVSACKKITDDTTSNVAMTIPDGFSTTGIDAETMQLLVDKGDHIDYIFRDLPLSMNQDGRNAVHQELRYISNMPLAGIPDGCSPMARKIYLSDGEIIMESDLYFSTGCLFQVFIKDRTPLFANLLSKEGIDFYVNLMQQAQQSMPEDIRAHYSIPESE